MSIKEFRFYLITNLTENCLFLLIIVLIDEYEQKYYEFEIQQFKRNITMQDIINRKKRIKVLIQEQYDDLQIS